MWWIGIVLIEGVGFLLVWRLLLTAAPKSEKELCYPPVDIRHVTTHH
jgi:hypothetical protein